MTLWKKALFIFLNLFFMVLLLFAFGEIYVRLKGLSPRREPQLGIEVEPGGKYFKKDRELGYRHIPGQFHITIKKQHSFTTTHRTDTLRITHPPNKRFSRNKKIWVMGCSFTHGWCLNDEETFPWLLQEKIPQFEVINYGVSGYGTIHSWIQIKNSFKTKPKPKLVILTYASFHDSRNTFTLARRSVVSFWNFLGPLTQPYASVGEDGELAIHQADEVVYSRWPFDGASAFINYLEKRYIQKQSASTPSFEVSKKIINKAYRACFEKDVPLVVAGIKDNRNKLERIEKYCLEKHIPYVNIAVDLERNEHNFLPLDAHPNALANRKYANRLYHFLSNNHYIDP